MEHQLFDNGSMTRRLIRALFLAVVMLSGNAILAQSPAYQFAVGIGGSQHDFGRSVATDANGNIYAAGDFAGTVDFDPGSGTANLSGGGMFVAKYNTSGNYIWAFSVQGGANRPAIAIDGSGNVYVTGDFESTADFNPGAGTANLSGGGVFIAKYSAAGNYLWAFALPSSWAPKLSVDGSGNAVVTGLFYGSVDFNPGSGNAKLKANVNDVYGEIFVAKYSASGAYQWALQIELDKPNTWPQGAPIIAASASSLDIDGGGNIYLTGGLSGTFKFGNTTLKSAGGAFVAKYSSAGNKTWAFALDGAGGSCVTIDGSGNAYVAGWFTGTVDFNPGSGTANLTSTTQYASSGYHDMYIAKYTAAGAYTWAIRVGGKVDISVGSIALNSDGNLYVTGSFKDTVDFDPGTSIAILTAPRPVSPNTIGNSNIYIASYMSTGIYRWAFAVNGDGSSGGESLSLDGSGNIYIAGWFSGTADFDPNAATANLTPAGGRDIFIGKYSDVLPLKPIVWNEYAVNDHTMRVIPNPFTGEFTFRYDGSAPSCIQILDLMGRVVESRDIIDFNQELSLGSQLSAGTYFLRIIQGEERRSMMIHKVK